MAKNTANNESVNFDFDLLDEIIKDAPSAGFGPRRNFGLLKIKLDVTHWDRTAKKFVTRPWDGKPIDKSKNEYFQITFTSNLGELNPAFQNEYKRRVDVRKSDKSNKDQSKWILTDWSESVEPALLKTLGAAWAKALTKGVYAEWQDIDTVEKDKDGNIKGWFKKDAVTGEEVIGADGNRVWMTNSVPQVTRVFKSKAEAQAAREEVYTKKDDDMSFGDDADIPAKVISDVQGILKALDGDQLLTLLSENAPYNQYDLVALLTTAGADADVIELAQAQAE